MAINFGKYKTYDDSKGRGSFEEWSSLFDGLGFKFDGYIPEDILKKYPPAEPSKWKSYKREGMEYCTDLKSLNTEFHKQLMQCHPDIAGDTKDNTQKTQQLIDKYNKLKQKFQ